MNAQDIILGTGVALLLALGGGFLLVATRSNRERLRFQLSLFLVAFGLRFALSIVIYNMGLLSALGDDDSSGWVAGIVLSDSWNERGLGLLDLPVAWLSAFTELNRGYKYLLAVLFFLTNAPNRLAAAAFSCVCGSLATVFSYRLALSARLSPRAAVGVGWWICLLPSMLVWSAQTVKEPIVIMFEVMGIYACSRMRSGGFTLRHLILFSGSIMILTSLRFYAAYITAAVAVVSVAIPQRGGRLASIVLSIVLFAVITLLLSQSGAMTRHQETFEQFSNLENSSQFRNDLASTANTGFTSGHDTKSTGGLLMVVSTGWFFLLLAPLPWQLTNGSLRQLLTLPEQLIWWPLFFTGVLPGAVGAIRNRLGDILPMLLVVLILGLVYSITSGNAGLMYRQRAQLLPYLMIFEAFHFERRRSGQAMTGRFHRE